MDAIEWIGKNDGFRSNGGNKKGYTFFMISRKVVLPCLGRTSAVGICLKSKGVQITKHTHRCRYLWICSLGKPVKDTKICGLIFI